MPDPLSEFAKKVLALMSGQKQDPTPTPPSPRSADVQAPRMMEHTTNYPVQYGEGPDGKVTVIEKPMEAEYKVGEVMSGPRGPSASTKEPQRAASTTVERKESPQARQARLEAKYGVDRNESPAQREERMGITQRRKESGMTDDHLPGKKDFEIVPFPGAEAAGEAGDRLGRAVRERMPEYLRDAGSKAIHGYASRVQEMDDKADQTSPWPGLTDFIDHGPHVRAGQAVEDWARKNVTTYGQDRKLQDLDKAISAAGEDQRKKAIETLKRSK